MTKAHKFTNLNRIHFPYTPEIKEALRNIAHHQDRKRAVDEIRLTVTNGHRSVTTIREALEKWIFSRFFNDYCSPERVVEFRKWRIDYVLRTKEIPVMLEARDYADVGTAFLKNL